MKKYISVTTCAVLLFLICADIFDFYPKLSGTAYYLFNLPHDSYKEVVVWLAMFFIAVTRLIEFKVGYLKHFKIFGDFFSVVLLLTVIFKLFQTLAFVVNDGAVELMEGSVSIFSSTSGRSVVLILLAVLLAAELWKDNETKGDRSI